MKREEYFKAQFCELLLLPKRRDPSPQFGTIHISFVSLVSGVVQKESCLIGLVLEKISQKAFRKIIKSCFKEGK